MDIIERLNQFVNSIQKSNSQFADEIGVPRPSFSQILNGRNRKLSNEFISKLHDHYPLLNINWLLFGEGNMIIDHTVDSSKNSSMSRLHTPNSFPNEAINNDSAHTDFRESLQMGMLNIDNKEMGDNSISIEDAADSVKNPNSPYNSSSEELYNSAQSYHHNERMDNSNPTTQKSLQKISSIILLFDDNSFEIYNPQ